MTGSPVLSAPTEKPCVICGATPSVLWWLMGGLSSWLCSDCRNDYAEWVAHHPSYNHFWELCGKFAAYAQGFPQPGGVFFEPHEFLDVETQMRDAIHAWIMEGRRFVQNKEGRDVARK